MSPHEKLVLAVVVGVVFAVTIVAAFLDVRDWFRWLRLPNVLYGLRRDLGAGWAEDWQREPVTDADADDLIAEWRDDLPGPGHIALTGPRGSEPGRAGEPHCCTHPGTGLCMCDCHDWDCDCGNRNTKMRSTDSPGRDWDSSRTSAPAAGGHHLGAPFERTVTGDIWDQWWEGLDGLNRECLLVTAWVGRETAAWAELVAETRELCAA